MVSFKIPCDLEGHLDLVGQLQGKCILFLSRFCAVHNFVYSLSNHFQFSTVVVEKGNFRLHRYDVINIFKLAYLLYLKSD